MAKQRKSEEKKAAAVEKKKLFVDLEVCAKCPKCVTECTYFYHPLNNGMIAVRERAALAVVCRRCENPVCISACTRDALEKDPDGVLRRYNMRCVGCKSCSIACPFGTVLPEVIPYAVSVCDYCLERLQGDEVPLCVKTCPLNAVRFEDVEEDVSENNYSVDEHLVVHALPWKREAVTG
jgi:Fe-S-cluster-containing dehydrogenase component